MAAQQTLPKRGADYPQRPAFFFHRFTRLLGKVCAAQHVGPDGAWLLTVIAATEDSARYKHAIAWTDEQICPFVGVSPSKMRRLRARCVARGWLHYESGWKGVPSLYWVTIPPGYDIRDGEYLDDELAQALQIRAQFDRESDAKAEGNAARNRRESASESGGKADALHTYSVHPNTSPAAAPSTGRDDGEEDSNSTARQVAGIERGPDTSLATTEAAIEQRLSEAGIRKPRKAIRLAQGNGLDLTVISAVVEHYERHPGYWEPWMLWTRMTDVEWASQPSDAGWPDPSEKALADAKARAQREATFKVIDQTHAPAKTQTLIDWDTLERELGPVIDAAPFEELLAIVGQAYSKVLREHGWRSKLCRQSVLRHFNEKKGTT